MISFSSSSVSSLGCSDSFMQQDAGLLLPLLRNEYPGRHTLRWQLAVPAHCLRGEWGPPGLPAVQADDKAWIRSWKFLSRLWRNLSSQSSRTCNAGGRGRREKAGLRHRNTLRRRHGGVRRRNHGGPLPLYGSHIPCWYPPSSSWLSSPCMTSRALVSRRSAWSLGRRRVGSIRGVVRAGVARGVL